MSGFNPNRSKVSDDTLAEFLASPIDEELLTVPGVGSATVERLAVDGITTTYQLIGVFLRVCDKGMSTQERTDAFWYYLQALKVPGGTRSTIVLAIAERLNVMFPGFYSNVDEG